MDPNANLAEQLDLAQRILNHPYTGVGDDLRAQRLAELVTALDEWIRKGGFPPSAWAHGQVVAPS